jgi:hypothetical protein
VEVPVVLAVMLCVLLTVWLLVVVPHTVPLAEVEGEPVLLAGQKAPATTSPREEVKKLSRGDSMVAGPATSVP